MQTCYKHGCMLVSSDISAKSEQCYSFAYAEGYVKDTQVVMADSNIQRFSEYMATIFDSPINFEGDIPISSILHYGLMGTKYMSKKGTTKYTRKLTKDLQAFYSTMGLSEITSMSQIQRHWFGERFDFSVVCQIAFLTGISIADITSPSLSLKHEENEKNTYYMINKKPINWNDLDKEIAPELEAFAKAVYEGTASENGRPERVSEKLVYRQFQLEEHRLEKLPQCRSVLEKYSETYPECWARKIVWAYNKLKSENKPFYWSDIRRLSGVKKANIEKVIPYIHI